MEKWKKVMRFFQRRKSEKRSLGRFLLYGFLGFSGIGLLGSGAFLFFVLSDLPEVDDLEKLTFSESTVIFASDGTTPLYSVHGDQNRKIISLSEMSQYLPSAILAAEDDRFYSHPGFDLGGIAMAACYKLTGICPPRGGSTITQQTIKNLFLTNERTLKRKAQEIVLAYRIEQNLSKDKILELYLNGISFGSNFYGAETASKAFFGKSVRDLTLAESAILARLPQSPSKFSPFGENAFSRVLISPEEISKNNYETFEDIDSLPGISWQVGLVGKNIELANGKVTYFPGRADWVLDRMLELGYISSGEFDAAKEEFKTTTFSKYREEITAPHFVFLIKSELEAKFGADMVEHGGLQVKTTLDANLQKMAEETVKEYQEKNITNYNAHNAALVALNPESGEIKVLVGSADYWNEEIDGKVNMIEAKRQPGSSFKPIVYATAFAQGILSPASVLMDVETDFGNDWIPKNYDGTYSGPVSVRYALGHSLNIPAVKAAILAAPDKVYDLAGSLGVSFDFDTDHYGAAIALGGAEVRPLDMASAFSALINGGKKIDPVAILEVKDRFGNILFQYDAPEEQEQILTPETAFLVTNVLSDPSARAGWGSVLNIGRPAMAKTGTSNEEKTGIARDTWTVGGTPNFAVAVWAGNNYPSKVPLGRLADGSSTAAPIWRDFLMSAEKDLAPRSFAIPSGISRVMVSKLSGKLPNTGTPPNLLTEDIFASNFVPTEIDDSLQFLEIDRVSGKLPNELTPEKSLKKVAILSLHSADTSRQSWEEPVQEWMKKNAADFLKKMGIEGEILANAPTEYDDVHTEKSAQQKPKITFISPTEGGIVSPPRITVTLDISAQNGPGEVNFLWDGDSVFSETSGQKFIVKIPKNSTGKHELTAIATDALWFESEETISVEIGSDEDAPEVSLSAPTTVRGENATKISAEAYDATGALEKVEFLVNGKRVGIDFIAPYETLWTPDNEIKTVILTALATDIAGNTARDEMEISIEKSGISTTFEILSPRNGGAISCEKVLFQMGISPDMIAGFEKMTIFGRKEGSEEFAALTNTSTRTRFGFLSAEWKPTECGIWEFYAESADGKQSPKIEVTLQSQ